MGTNLSQLPLSQIHMANEALATRLQPSPCLKVQDGFDQRGDLFVKAENLMPTGSFKIRGATYRISLLTKEERQRGVIAYSTGNHAQAVAKAANDAGVKALIVMSDDVPDIKIKATEQWGASIVMAEATSQARRALAEKLADEQGLVIVPPYDDLAVMAGQGTIGLELLEQMPVGETFTVYVPIGGGGLLAGVAAALKQSNEKIRVVGVEPELEDDAYQSIKSGRLIGLPGPSESVADAIKVQQLGDLTFPIIQNFVDDIELVSEAEIISATSMCWSKLKLVVEPGGAVALAAARRAAKCNFGQVVALLCGGNIELEKLIAIEGVLSK